MLYAHDSARGMFDRADLAMRRRQWSRAADLFARAYGMDANMLHATFFQGAALIEAGQKDEGQKVIELAGVRPLSNEEPRAELIAALDAHGLPERAAEQRTILVRTGAFESPHVAAALGPEAARAEEAGEFARAAVLRERLAAAGDDVSASPVALLTASADAHRLRARAAIQAGDFEDAKRQAARCFDLLPGAVESAVVLVKDFERAGKKDEADLIFRRASENLSAALKSHPKAEFLQRDLARLKAGCGRE
jgi:hypothetical protein